LRSNSVFARDWDCPAALELVYGPHRPEAGLQQEQCFGMQLLVGAGHACDSGVFGGAVVAGLICGRMHGILVQV